MEIRKLALDKLDEAVAFSWNLCLQKCTRSYTIFQNITELKEEYEWRITHEDGEIVGCYVDNQLVGILCYFKEQENQYLQTTGFYIKENCVEAADYLASFIENHYPDYVVKIGITRENTTVTEALTKMKFKLIEDSIDLRLYIENLLIGEEDMSGIKKIDESDMPDYLIFHNNNFQNYYWNAERIKADFNNWNVYAEVKGEIVTSGVFIRCYKNQTAEVYGLCAPDEASCRRLLIYSIEDLVHTYPKLKSIIFMIEAVDHRNILAALAVGFLQENHYCCWEKQM